MQVAKPVFSIGIKDVNVPADPALRMRRDAAQSLLEEILFSRSGRFYTDLFEEGLITPSYSYGYSSAEGFAFHAISGECDTPETVEEEIAVRELSRTLSAFLRTLGEREEFIFVCRYYYADSVAKIAQMLGLSEKTIRRDLALMKKDLKAFLEKGGYFYET